MNIHNAEIKGIFKPRLTFTTDATDPNREPEPHSILAYTGLLGRFVSWLYKKEFEKVQVHLNDGNKTVKTDVYVNIGSILMREVLKPSVEVEKTTTFKDDFKKTYSYILMNITREPNAGLEALITNIKTVFIRKVLSSSPTKTEQAAKNQQLPPPTAKSTSELFTLASPATPSAFPSTKQEETLLPRPPTLPLPANSEEREKPIEPKTATPTGPTQPAQTSVIETESPPPQTKTPILPATVPTEPTQPRLPEQAKPAKIEPESKPVPAHSVSSPDSFAMDIKTAFSQSDPELLKEIYSKVTTDQLEKHWELFTAQPAQLRKNPSKEELLKKLEVKEKLFPCIPREIVFERIKQIASMKTLENSPDTSNISKQIRAISDMCSHDQKMYIAKLISKEDLQLTFFDLFPYDKAVATNSDLHHLYVRALSPSIRDALRQDLNKVSIECINKETAEVKGISEAKFHQWFTRLNPFCNSKFWWETGHGFEGRLLFKLKNEPGVTNIQDVLKQAGLDFKEIPPPAEVEQPIKEPRSPEEIKESILNDLTKIYDIGWFSYRIESIAENTPSASNVTCNAQELNVQLEYHIVEDEVEEERVITNRGPVTIKILSPEHSTEGKLLEKAYKSIERAQWSNSSTSYQSTYPNLNHNPIIKYINEAKIDGNTWVAIGRIEGDTLKSYLSRNEQASISLKAQYDETYKLLTSSKVNHTIKWDSDTLMVIEVDGKPQLQFTALLD